MSACVRKRERERERERERAGEDTSECIRRHADMLNVNLTPLHEDSLGCGYPNLYPKP